MTHIEYELLREDRKDLDLPPYYALLVNERGKVGLWDREQLIAGRTARLLGREVGGTDLVRVSEPDSLPPRRRAL